MINVSKLDPCLSFAFLIKSQNEFIDFKLQLEEIFSYSNTQIFHVFKSHEEFMNNLDSSVVKSVNTMSFRLSSADY
jgi:hypothetical protein